MRQPVQLLQESIALHESIQGHTQPQNFFPTPYSGEILSDISLTTDFHSYWGSIC